jgi:hypothetical protein
LNYYNDVLNVKNIIKARYDTFHSPVTEAVPKTGQPIPLFPSTGTQWIASVRMYFLEYFGLDPESPSADNSLKWYSLCHQQIECIVNEGVRKEALEVFRALHFFKGNMFGENVQNPLFGIEGSESPSEYLNLKKFFGSIHLPMFLALLSMVRTHRLLVLKRNEFNHLKNPSRQDLFCVELIDIPLRLCEETMLYLLDRFESKYCRQTLPWNIRGLSKSSYPLYRFYQSVVLDYIDVIPKEMRQRFLPTQLCQKVFEVMYATLIRAKAWKEDVLDKHPEAGFHIVCQLGQTELLKFSQERKVANDNLLNYLLRLSLKEIDTFIEQMSVNKNVRDKVIAPIQEEFAKSTVINDFIQSLLKAKTKNEKKHSDSKASLLSDKEKEAKKAVSFDHLIL